MTNKELYQQAAHREAEKINNEPRIPNEYMYHDLIDMYMKGADFAAEHTIELAAMAAQEYMKARFGTHDAFNDIKSYIRKYVSS